MSNGDIPAMPVWNQHLHPVHVGLTKREHFAAMAMQGMLSSGMSIELGPSHPKNNGDIAICATVVADALLKALESEQ